MDLKGKRILITGATRGIGVTTARYLVELGAQIIAVGRSASLGKKLEQDFPGRVVFHAADLANREQLDLLLNWIENDVDRLDALISNASRDSNFSVLNVTKREWDELMTLNLTSPAFLSQVVAKKMIGTGVKNGKIIHLGAIQAIMPLADSFAYSTTKGGIISATRSMAVDLGRYGIQVITVLPGPIYNTAEEPPAGLDSRAATVLGRMGRNREVAKLLAFLVSDDNTFMTGNQIVIDGGRLISRLPDPTEIASHTI
jgi:NAD(P)-dependent dehydrogenase (short-subunit alcohol dehydrogenase family)